MKIKFGLKLWSIDHFLLSQAAELIERDMFQYIELMPLPGTDISPFSEIDVPYFIHATTEKHGVNIANKSKKKFDLGIINVCIEWADSLEAKYLILHPGYGSINDAMGFLGEIEDRRILIENMPKIGIGNEKMIGYGVEQLKKLMNNRFGLCLDLGHAIKAAASLNRDYKRFMKELLELNPRVFHISDGKSNDEKDEHLPISAGDYDFDFLIGCIRKNRSKYVTLETPRNSASLDEDLKNLEKLMEQAS